MILPKSLASLFNPSQDIDFADVVNAMADMSVRMSWAEEMVREIQRINSEVDQRLLTGQNEFADLSGRRKGLQYALEAALSIHRALRGRKVQNRGHFNLESVTVQPAPK